MYDFICYICQARITGPDAQKAAEEFRKHLDEHVKQDEEGTGEDRHKFRLWQKDKQGYASELDEIFLAHDGRVWLNEPSYEWHDITDKCIIEFCTGLKDKNGKLICEGDILRESMFEEEMPWATWLVVFQGAGFGKRPCVPGNHIASDRKFHCFYDSADDELHKFDRLCIVGNIHQNPELLK